MMIKRWPPHIPHLPHHKITIYGWSTSPRIGRLLCVELHVSEHATPPIHTIFLRRADVGRRLTSPTV